VVIEDGKQTAVPAAPVKALDTNGAGDMFAGAFLYAVTQGHCHTDAAWLANQAAGQVVAQYGNRLTIAQLQGIRKQFEAHLQR
jgi:sugar/nucleoside kinase (ribokinase family)